MSEQLQFDRKKGFVALPVDVLDMDLSPGAFRTLVELCRMANREGFCWPSLAQLAEKLGRSKASISGYLKDLRDAALIETQEQRTANGYNYRLKYRVTFWQDWRGSLRGQTTQKPERSVQPIERLEESKNHIHKTHSLPAAAEGIDQILKAWGDCFRGAPYPTAAKFPSEQLIATSADMVNLGVQLETIISADIEAELSSFFQRLRIMPSDADMKTLSKHVRDKRYSTDEFTFICAAISKAWPAHWRKPPTPDQFEKLAADVGLTPTARKFDLLKSYISRWAMAENALQLRGPSGSLAAKQGGIHAA
ncbi:helix-turn-helix domain-containing protein [Yoonia sp. 208BN28-4]|uniref:helix-turn-helix domain-containing protein n=1 Tax=Yoonia sp. 208BN28-4 TaxID=3126505 RepID=UPI00309E0267